MKSNKNNGRASLPATATNRKVEQPERNILPRIQQLKTSSSAKSKLKALSSATLSLLYLSLNCEATYRACSRKADAAERVREAGISPALQFRPCITGESIAPAPHLPL